MQSKEMFFEVKMEESEKVGSPRESSQGHLACAASALRLSYIWQPDNHQPSWSWSSIYTAQVVLKCLSLTPSSLMAGVTHVAIWGW